MQHVIRNFEKLATTQEREDALSIAEAGYAGVNTRGAIMRTLRINGDNLIVAGHSYPLAGRKVRYVGVGKCAIAAAGAIEELLSNTLTDGIALDVSSDGADKLTRVEVHVGTHPEPSDVNMQATARIIEFLSSGNKDDLVLILVSGGGSTLLCLHDAPMTCLDERMLFEALTAKGASIQDLNTVRKHISKARGGGLAKAAYPAEVVALIVSDVPGNDINYIASGPTVLDESTVADALAVLARYGVAAPEGAQFIETPKEQKYFDRVTNVLFVTNRDALEAMQAEATRRGYRAEIVDDSFKGDVREVGRTIVATLHNAPVKSAFLYAGESTVSLGESHGRGPTTLLGAGGRNQELALSVLESLQKGELVLPFASDGRDNSDRAGAIADTATLSHAKQSGLVADDHLHAHTSYNFFTKTEDFLDTGFTGSNVSDIIITLKN